MENTRELHEFDHTWNLVLDSQDIESILDSVSGIDAGVTGLLVQVGEGEYTGLWATWYAAPYANTAVYERVL